MDFCIQTTGTRGDVLSTEIKIQDQKSVLIEPYVKMIYFVVCEDY